MRTQILIAALTLTLTGCANKSTPAERATPVETVAVQSFSGKDIKRYSAVMQPYEQVDLSFRVGGYVSSIAQVRGIEGRQRAVQDGDRVTRGTVLARLHSTDYDARTSQSKAALAEAETLLAKAQLDRERAERLYNSQSLTKPDFDSAKANYEASQARVESARARVQEASTSSNDAALRAPFAATVLKRTIAPGTLAAPGAPAFTLVDTTVVKAMFGVPDTLMARMRLGQTLTLQAEALGDRELSGRISRIASSADPRSRVFEIEVSIPNPKDELKIGMIATLVIDEKPPELGSPVVPISAVVSSPKRPGAFALYVTEQTSAGPVARLRDVELGRTLGNEVVIRRGAQLGEHVVTTGAGLLRDGERIEIATATAQSK